MKCCFTGLNPLVLKIIRELVEEIKYAYATNVMITITSVITHDSSIFAMVAIMYSPSKGK